MWLNKFISYRWQNWNCLKSFGLTVLRQKRSLNFYCGNVLYTEVSFKAVQWKKVAQSNSRSPFFSKWLYKIRVMIYRISQCPNWFELARPAPEKCPDLLTWKTGMEDGSSGISASNGDFHPQQRLLSEKFLVGSGITWTLITLPKEGEFP